MIVRLNRHLALGVSLLLMLPLLQVAPAAGQEPMQRFRVLIPDFFPLEGADKDFGEDAAKALRELMIPMATHQPVERDDIEDTLDDLDLDMEDLDCVATRQLGRQMEAQVAICASYSESGDTRNLQGLEVWALGNMDSFEIPAFTADKDQPEEAARTIFDAFDLFNQQHRYATFCNDYAQAQRWEDALRNCDLALGLNPGSVPTLYQKGYVLFKLERYQESLESLREVLEAEPYKSNALQTAGYVAAELGLNEESREYYGRYLELNPGDVTIRRNIAYEMYELGDAEGAMLLIEEGLDLSEGTGLYQDLGNYAFAAARNAAMEAGVDQQQAGAQVPAQVADLYRTAIDAYMQVFAADGAAMEVVPLRNVLAAYIQLDELDEAIATAEEILAVRSDDAALWNTYATALQRSGRVDDALEALAHVEQLSPDFPDLYARQGNMLLSQDRIDEALEVLRKGVERGQSPDRAARIVLARAHGEGVQKENWGYAIQLVDEARSFDVSQEQQEELNFWLGYSLLRHGRILEEPKTVETARQTLPMFQRAQSLLQGATGYDARQGGRMNVPQLLEAVAQYIDIEEAVIRRGGGLP